MPRIPHSSKQVRLPPADLLALTSVTAVVAMTLARRNGCVRVRRAMRSEVPVTVPVTVAMAVTMAVTMAMPMAAEVRPGVVQAMSAHFVVQPKESARSDPVDDDVAEIEVMLVPGAVMVSLPGRRWLGADGKRGQQGQHRQSPSFHLLVSVCG